MPLNRRGFLRNTMLAGTAAVEMLGTGQKMKWTQTGDALTISAPIETKTSDIGYGFKVSFA